ncbi:MAG: BNR-4 repeat-containing protein [Verrucomicrobia bacterium]|nr:BNR-4 repeat-containing protein [Verrucomicrobiota bacterium]MDA1067330.1 BNR-4 repeat-containing protein [Verrucomicrobiota bacterium]
MRKIKIQILLLLAALLFGQSVSHAKVTSFANNGTLKMFYDNRMYPQAVVVDETMFAVWRGADGHPFVISYDLKKREFSKSLNLMVGYEDEADLRHYERDHHLAPVIWSDSDNYLHVLHGCHRTKGMHLISAKPGSAERWVRGPDISESISYPKVHRIYNDQILIYSRLSGHLGYWWYHISGDGGRTWDELPKPAINLSGEPQDGKWASFSGSYNTTAVSADGKRLHIAFIWKVEDPVFNTRYNEILHDHTQRYNLYYLYVDLPSGKAYNIQGEEVELPVRKKTADEKLLVWDTDERPAVAGPSISLDKDDKPHFLLPVSDEDDILRSHFYFVSHEQNEWRTVQITKTLHPFNSSYLEQAEDGVYHATMITGSGEKVIEEGMDEYGYGLGIEHWTSADDGASWEKEKDLSPVRGMHYQNIQYISNAMKEPMKNMLLFYGWDGRENPGEAFLWDGRDK